MRQVVAALALLVSGVYEQRNAFAEHPSLMFTLETSRSVYAKGDPIDLTVSIRNRRDGQMWAVLPAVTFYPNDSWPDLQVDIDVTDPSGTRLLPPVPAAPVVKRVLPAPCDFLVLQPRSSLGEALSLTEGPLAREFAVPGRYRLEGRLTSRARTWLTERIRAGEIKEAELRVPLDRVFEGVLESAPITIEIR